MRNPSLFFHKQVMPCLLVLTCLLIALPGCSLREIREQTETADKAGFIRGKVRLATDQKGLVNVLRFRDENNIPVLESQVVASEKGDFMFPVFPGDAHYIVAFIDANGDDRYQPGEHGNYYGEPSTIEVAVGHTLTLDPITISGPVPKVETGVKPIDRISAAWKNIGRIATLDDPRFTRENYRMGFWRPFDFLEVAEGGLFFLREYDHGKVPVIFIHGVMGGPPDLRAVIESVDPELFQPWVFYYPTGFRLDMISDYLVEAVTRLQKRHGFRKFNVIAHSMGGLVARSFVKKYIDHSSENKDRLGLVMTVNSPMAGMPAAAAGVKNSPIVVPSWRDVEPDSDFLKEIHSWDWPGEIPYHLVISYIDGKSGDGTVPLQSQVPLKLQSESTRMYVFNNNHVGTLKDMDFLALFNSILKDSVGRYSMRVGENE